MSWRSYFVVDPSGSTMGTFTTPTQPLVVRIQRTKPPAAVWLVSTPSRSDDHRCRRFVPSGACLPRARTESCYCHGCRPLQSPLVADPLGDLGAGQTL